MKRKDKFTLLERFYYWEILKGVFLTGSKFIGNLGIYLLKCVGFCKNRSPWITIEYPDDIRPYPPRYRGRHRLTLNEDGEIKCTSCFLCATACPAKCIYIEPEEHPDSSIEKIPRRYEIDTLLCIYCGYCVEACPVDAIRMDTGLHPIIYPADPRLFIEDKEVLLQRSRDIEKQGIDSLRKEHLQNMRALERKTGQR
ncbi:MAG: NADH-quinone oxidoreductase subunit I [Deltaproteobacteria bacterium]|nr:NADH-quinone oxidoreductase subunit I [Deltaproteobacteria bacterium]